MKRFYLFCHLFLAGHPCSIHSSNSLRLHNALLPSFTGIGPNLPEECIE